jgi:flagellar hook-associated protein FlgK
MATIGTFSSFTTARLAIYASQASLNVTGNNIANINTKGYTRQRMDLVSLNSTGQPKYKNNTHSDIGYGVLCRDVTQLRDPYLDIRFRDEQTELGSFTAEQKALQALQSIYDEVAKGENGGVKDVGIIEDQLGQVFDMLDGLNQRVGTEEYDSQLRAACKTLCQLLNSAAKRTETVRDNQANLLREDVGAVNDLLHNIRGLSEQIRAQGIAGDSALELRDSRNVLIDELSKYLKIDVTYTDEKLDQFTTVEKMTITLSDTQPPIKLVDGIYATQLLMPEEIAEPNPEYDEKRASSYMYEAREGKGVSIDGKWYTNIEREAKLDANGDATLNATFGADGIKNYQHRPMANPNYPDPDAANPYMMENPAYPDPTDPTVQQYIPTNDLDKAAPNMVPSFSTAKGDEDDNVYLLQLDALKDRNGRFMRDEYGQEIREITDLNDVTLHGSIQALREFLTEEGEFCSADELKLDPDAAKKRGVRYYQHVLDNWAQTFARELNKANQMPPSTIYEMDGTGEFFEDKDGNQITADGNLISAYKRDDKGNVITDANGAPVMKEPSDYTAAELDALRASGQLKREYAYYEGGVIFSSNGNSNDPTGITARNISVSNAWATGAVRILNTTKPDYVDADGNVQTSTTASDNIQHMLALFKADREFIAQDTVADSQAGRYFFKGSFQEMYTNISGTLASDSQYTNKMYEAYTLTSLDLDNQRSSVSGVDLNEEATSMMQFSKSYSAACRLLTTIDSMLDKLINGTAI